MTLSEWFWLWIPFCASALLAIMLVPLGERVLHRGVVFADIAIAQWAALGVLVGGQLVWVRKFESSFSVFSLSGLVFALLASGLVHLILRYYVSHREAMIGTLYVAGASLATMSVSHDPHGAQALAATLNGDLLWSSASHLYMLIPIAVLVLVWQTLPLLVQERCFLPLFALAITIAVEVAGIYVVFSTLITAPLLVCRIAHSKIIYAVIASMLAHFIGLAIAAWQDYPVGPSIVLSSIVFTACLSVVIQKGRY